jgi:hypothetical protein
LTHGVERVLRQRTAIYIGEQFGVRNYDHICEAMSPGLVPEWDMADRMRKALRHGGLTVAAMAEYPGVSRQSVENWTGGRIEPGTQTLRLWALRTGLSYDWLAGDAHRSQRARRAAPAAVRRLDG